LSTSERPDSTGIPPASSSQGPPDGARPGSQPQRLAPPSSAGPAAAASEPALPAVGNEHAPTSRDARRPLRRRYAAAGAALLAGGLFAGGAFAGFTYAQDRAVPTGPTLDLPQAAAETDTAAPSGPVVVPDVLDMLADDAEDALADAGVDLARVGRSEVPWAGTPGRVVGQEPRRGTRDPRQVTLRVSAATTVPDLSGKTRDDAVAALEQLGATVVVSPAYEPGSAAGQVRAVDPASGQPLPDRVVLRITGEPAAVFLDAVETSSGGCRNGTFTVAGQDLDHSLVCAASGSRPSAASYALDGTIDRFEALAGTGDDTGRATVRLIGDGRVLLEAELEQGSATALAAPLTGVRELVVEVQGLDDDSTAEIVLGQARLLGTEDAVERTRVQ
jgi:hypothetical protein